MKNKILLICYGGGHVKVLEPLYHSLKLKYDVSIIALTSAGHYLKNKGVPFFSFKNFPELLTEQVELYGSLLSKDINSFDIVSEEESIAYLGRSFFDLVNSLGDECEAWKLYSKDGRKCFLPVATLKSIILKMSPNLVITTNAPRAERAALIAARDLGIRTLCINDNLWVNGGILDVAMSNLADKICVLAECVKTDLIKRTEYLAENIYVTGTPVFDKLKLIKKDDRTAVVKNILLADCDLPEHSPAYPNSSGDPMLGHRIRQELNKLSKVVDNWNVIFRPHPSQTSSYDDYDSVSYSDPKDDLNILLAKTDLIITAISTVGIEGKMIGIPIVSIEGTVYSQAGSYSELGISTGIYDESQLKDAINKELVNNVGMSLYDGNSLENIGLVVSSLLNNS